ncbi:hypothetical protein ES703_06725 [subsurface metagenome]
MSTRCQIEFMHISTREEKEGLEKGKIVKVIRRRTVYRHSDGYPESVIPDLEEFLEWNRGRNYDLEYQAANFIYWSKKKMEEQIERDLAMMGYIHKEQDVVPEKERKIQTDKRKSEMRRQMILTGHGICNNDEFHPDISYYYEVISDSETKEITIKCYQPVHPVPKKKEDFKLINYKMLPAGPPPVPIKKRE